jgi:hypothetical protein
VSIELEPNELRALFEKRRLLQENKVFSDTLLDPEEVMLVTRRPKRKISSALTTQ